MVEKGILIKNGKLYDDGECVVFPSKEMRDWRKFDWKKGDVLVSEDGTAHLIFEKFTDDTYTTFIGKYHYANNDYYVSECDSAITDLYTLETENSAQTYINTIEERLGGKLNRETLEVEKAQPEFKDGDIVVYGESVAICRRIYKHTLSFYVSLNEMVGLLFADEVESSEEYRFATDEDKQQLFDALAKEGKAWDAEKKQIVDLKPKVELKPFDRVLVRNCKSENWRACYKEGFVDCAKWAINEFLKNLWHPASEAPKRRCNYLLLHYKDKEEECFEADVVDTKAWDCYIKGSLVEYINIDDLFPKKGGEQ